MYYSPTFNQILTWEVPQNEFSSGVRQAVWEKRHSKTGLAIAFVICSTMGDRLGDHDLQTLKKTGSWGEEPVFQRKVYQHIYLSASIVP